MSPRPKGKIEFVNWENFPLGKVKVLMLVLVNQKHSDLDYSGLTSLNIIINQSILQSQWINNSLADHVLMLNWELLRFRADIINLIKITLKWRFVLNDRYLRIKAITIMKKNTTRDTNGVLGEAHEVGCTLKRSFVKIWKILNKIGS